MQKTEKKYYQRAFFYALIIAVVLLLPFVAIDGGYFVYYGDYNAQQIPFYKTCIRAIQSGNFGWNWQTDLGVNFVGSYSFYTLGSPFFWLAAMFPVSISQYLMAPLLALKLALSSLFAFAYIRRFVTRPNSALIGGLLYAFSGFSMYNVFFNHFHEAIVFFPLLLIGLEEAVVNKRRGALVLAVAINAMVNYFFFIGECVFLVIYFVVRICTSKEFRISFVDFLCLAFESIGGVLIAGILFVPSIFQVLDVPRSTQILNGWGFLFYTTEQRYGLLLEAMFFPPEIPARTNMFTDANAKWSSVALYLPLFSMAGVISFIKGAKKHWAKAVLLICLLMAFVPGLNSTFVLFNNNFYTRWFYMPELICCLATVYVLEHEEIDMKFGWRACTVVVAIMSALVLFFPKSVEKEIENPDGTKEKIKQIVPRVMDDMPSEVYISIVIAVAFLVALWFVIRQRERLKRREFNSRVMAATAISCLALGFYFIGYGRILGPYVGDYNKSVSAQIHIDDPDFYRMEAIDEINNVNMLWDMSSLRSFTSIIPSSTFEMYDLIGVNRSVNSAPKEEYYAMRSLCRVKYLIVDKNYNEKNKQTVLDEHKVYQYLETQGDYEIYVNKYALPMGFAYDQYSTAEQIKDSTQPDRLMVRSVVLSDEQAEKYSDILKPLSDEATGSVDLERFKKYAQERIDAGVIRFSVNNSGFTAMTNYESDELVVFSVPYDAGWRAEIKGASAEIEKVNGGMMAIRVPAGIQEISFTYDTPGGKLGVISSVAGIVGTALYVLFWYVVRRHKPSRYAHLYLDDQVEGVRAHSSYIAQLSKQIGSCEDKGKCEAAQDKLEWPDIEESFMDRKKYDFRNMKPKKRDSHITEDDEAYRVLKELDEKKNDDII